MSFLIIALIYPINKKKFCRNSILKAGRYHGGVGRLEITPSSPSYETGFRGGGDTLLSQAMPKLYYVKLLGASEHISNQPYLLFAMLVRMAGCAAALAAALKRRSCHRNGLTRSRYRSGVGCICVRRARPNDEGRTSLGNFISSFTVFMRDGVLLSAC